MKCVSCFKEVSELDTKFFLQVLLCPVCAVTAEKARNKIRSELEAALARLDQTVRSALTLENRNFSFHAMTTMLSREALGAFIEMEELVCRSQIHSSLTMRPGVASTDGESSSSSPKAAD
jgi:hypothetical protein